MYNIGIIGSGFVGTAVAHGFSAAVGYDANIFIYDKNPLRATHSLDEVVCQADFVFISVPTPSNKDGSINLSIIEACLQEIQETAAAKNCFQAIYLIRSTITPGTTRRLQKKFTQLNIVFNPEFLMERTAKFDFISQSRFILGGEPELTNKVAELYRHRFGTTANIIETDFETAELTKYVANTYLATKVSFMNEMYQLAKKVGADWPMVVEGFLRDGRIGHSHTQVPGPDGKLGFGGSCFPKDVQALLQFASEHNIDLPTLAGAWQTNLKVRPERDWEKLVGRAVVDS